MKNIAIVLAGGKGSRMNSDIAKQYINVLEKPLICHTLDVFEKSFIDEVVLVVPETDKEYCKREIIDKYGYKKIAAIAEGGVERYHSVYNGLRAIKDCQYVFIHDGARPCLTVEMLERGLKAVIENKAVVAAVKVKDTIKVVSEDGTIISTPDRNSLYQIQTPQIFDYVMIKQAYENMIQDEARKNITDDGMVMEEYGQTPVKVYEGDYANIKVTTPEDIALAQVFIGGKI